METNDQKSIKKVSKICKDILKLTEEDFQAIEKMAAKQMEYIHPLKYATAAKFNKLGEHNERVLKELRSIQSTIASLKAE